MDDLLHKPHNRKKNIWKIWISLGKGVKNMTKKETDTEIKTENNIYVRVRGNEYPYKNIKVISGDLWGSDGAVVFETTSSAGRTRKVKAMCSDITVEEEITQNPF